MTIRMTLHDEQLAGKFAGSSCQAIPGTCQTRFETADLHYTENLFIDSQIKSVYLEEMLLQCQCTRSRPA
jgi:hypothetical protein